MSKQFLQSITTGIKTPINELKIATPELLLFVINNNNIYKNSILITTSRSILLIHVPLNFAYLFELKFPHIGTKTEIQKLVITYGYNYNKIVNIEFKNMAFDVINDTYLEIRTIDFRREIRIQAYQKPTLISVIHFDRFA